MPFSKVKLLFGSVLLLFSLFLISPPTARAQCAINMPDWSPDRVQQCLIPGATLSIVGSIGNAGFYLIETARVVKEFNDQQTADNKVSLEYRLFADHFLYADGGICHQ